MAARVLWAEHTSEEIAQAAKENALVIVPLGCTEQHAFHLPVDTDTFQVETMVVEGAKLAAERHGVKVLVLPIMPYGPASEHYGLPGTISFPNEVYLQVIKHIVWSVIDNGFRRIGVQRGCGGHWIVPGVLWDVKADAERAGKELIIRMLVGGDRTTTQRLLPSPSGHGHAGDMETALCLARREHLVRKDRMIPPELNKLQERYREGGEVFLFHEISSTGALGDACDATVEVGQKLWEARIEAFAKHLKFLEDQDRELGRFGGCQT